MWSSDNFFNRNALRIIETKLGSTQPCDVRGEDFCKFTDNDEHQVMVKAHMTLPFESGKPNFERMNLLKKL